MLERVQRKGSPPTLWVECTFLQTLLKNWRDFPGGPVVKNLPSNVEDLGSIPSRGTKVPHAWATKPTRHNY